MKILKFFKRKPKSYFETHTYRIVHKSTNTRNRDFYFEYFVLIKPNFSLTSVNMKAEYNRIAKEYALHRGGGIDSNLYTSYSTLEKAKEALSLFITFIGNIESGKFNDMKKRNSRKWFF